MEVRLKVTLLLWFKSSCLSWNFNEKGREVCIRERSPLASVAFIGQVTEHKHKQWPIYINM